MYDVIRDWNDTVLRYVVLCNNVIVFKVTNIINFKSHFWGETQSDRPMTSYYKVLFEYMVQQYILYNDIMPKKHIDVPRFFSCVGGHNGRRNVIFFWNKFKKTLLNANEDFIVCVFQIIQTYLHKYLRLKKNLKCIILKNI